MSRFEGDGRRAVSALPEYVLEGTRPIAVKRATARALIQMFDTSGYANHSGQGGVLWVIIEHCETSGIKYNISGEPGVGFFVQRVP